MKSIAIILTLLCLLNTSIYAQGNANFQLTGKVVSDDNQPLEYASVSLLKFPNTFIEGVITDDKGKFSFNSDRNDSLVLKIEFLGYTSITKEIVNSERNKKLNIGDIKLINSTRNLEEVSITAERSAYSIQLDKKIFNVGKDLLSQGGATSDLLNQVPLVSVSPDGAVSLRGNSAVQILINGKRSGLTMNNAIDQLSPDNILRVEVITNPSASMDAGGTAGIINIVLKKARGMGLNGQVRVSAGLPANHMLQPGINYRSEKFNFFSNVRLRYSDYNGRYSTEQIDLESKQTTLSLFEREDRHDDGLSIYSGFDFYPSKNQTITVAYFRASTKDSDATDLSYDLIDESESTNRINRIGTSVEQRAYNQLEASYSYDFKKLKSKLNIDMQYDFWDSNKNWNLESNSERIIEKVADKLRTNNIAGSRDFMLRADYNGKVFSKGKFQSGLKFEQRRVSNDYLAETFTEDNWNVFQGIDNDVQYDESISAAYTEYEQDFGKIGIKLGLRAEHTQISIADEKSEFGDSYDYTNLFPSGFLSYKLTEQHSLQLAYSKRINRPSLWSLYPFFEIKDFNSQYIGNPNLRPSYSDGLELNYLMVGKKLTLNPSVYYKFTNNPISQVADRNTNDILLVQPINIDKKQEMGVDISARYQPAKFLMLRGEMNVNMFSEQGSYESISLNASGVSNTARLSASLTPAKNWQSQISFDYRGPRVFAQGREFASYDVTAGISKSFLDDNLNLSFRAMNIFDSRIQRSFYVVENVEITNSRRRVGRRFMVSILYKFNQTRRDRLRRQNRQNR